MKFLWHILGKKAIKSNIKTKKSLDVESPEYFQCKKIHKDEWLEDYQASFITQFTKPVKIYLQMFKSFYISLITVISIKKIRMSLKTLVFNHPFNSVFAFLRQYMLYQQDTF